MHPRARGIQDAGTAFFAGCSHRLDEADSILVGAMPDDEQAPASTKFPSLGSDYAEVGRIPIYGRKKASGMGVASTRISMV
jgi:hypothetical protein